MNIVILMSPVVLCCLSLDNSWKTSCQCFIELKDKAAANAVILPKSAAHSDSAFIS